MKVRIVTTVEVDPEAWALEYGIEKKEVRKDVQEYFKHYPQQIVDQLGLFPDPTNKQ